MTATQDSLYDKAEALFKDLKAVTEVREQRMATFRLPPDAIPKAAKILTGKLGVKHLAIITGVDEGESVGLVYAFSKEGKTLFLQTSVSKKSLKAPSIVEIVPGAVLYEMEVHDFFGVVFEGHPSMDQFLVLPEDYPKDAPPLMWKTTQTSQLRKILEERTG